MEAEYVIVEAGIARAVVGAAVGYCTAAVVDAAVEDSPVVVGVDLARTAVVAGALQLDEV